MAVKYYLSTDASAPTLNGTVGSLIGVLDACLINGYGAKTALGWTKSYSGTNKAAYKSGDAGATGFYLRVDDTTTTYASVRGYETMSDVDNGTNLFPTAVQEAGYYQQKSNTADSTARPWIVVGDERMIYFFHNGLQTSLTNIALYGFIFGDIVPFAASDPYACVMGSTNATGYGGNTAAGNQSEVWHVPSGLNPTYKKYVARVMAGTGTSTNWLCWGHSFQPASAAAYPLGAMSSNMTYPAPADSGIHLHPVLVTDGVAATNGNYQLRGKLPGVYEPWEYRTAFTATTTSIGGITYLQIATDTHNQAADGWICIDVTGPWR